MWICLSGVALAADVDLFELSPALARGQGSPQGESPSTGVSGPTAAVYGGAVRDPVRAFDGVTEQEAVSWLVPVLVHAGISVDEHLRADLSLPLYARVDAPLVGFLGPAVSDLRAQLTVPIPLGDGPVGLALVPSLGLPSGREEALLSRGWHGGIRLAVGGDGRRAGWLFNAGAAAAERTELPGGLSLGNEAIAVTSAWLRAGPARLGAEVDLRAGLTSLEHIDGDDSSSGHLFAQVGPHRSTGGLSLTAVAGTGLLAGVGSPRWRLLGGVAYSEIVRDRDSDGVLDRHDTCITEPEDIDGFEDIDGCPDPDNDLDLVLDSADRCALLPEDRDSFEDDDGCPDPDNDGDGLPDDSDRCPLQAGSPATMGCPDRDGDGLADDDDRCPEEPGPLVGCPDRDADGFADRDDPCPDVAGEDLGCPPIVTVTEEAIEITERVEFELGSAVLTAESSPVLDAVARALAEHPSVLRVEVQGHTDNVGSDKANLTLSHQRAESVVRYLMSKGIDPARLIAVGYGESKPRFTNRTASGREQNRRVQFVILERAAP